jgi:hypothetical protein
VIDDVREWHAAEGDWRANRERIAGRYGYDSYGGACHIVPNHALVVHALLHGDGDFSRSLMIVNTCGWDTDCNAGNVGCILGIRNGLAGIDATWREPVADRMYLATAEGGRAITDAVRETDEIVAIARALAGEPDGRPKDGARFHFSLPGSVQGFRSAANEDGVLVVRGASMTPTFIPEEAIAMPGYALLASPTLYAGQEIVARVRGGARLVLKVYGAGDALVAVDGPETEGDAELRWRVPDTGGAPIAEVGIAATGEGAVALDWLTWTGAPTTTFARPADGGTMWRRAWVNGVDKWEPHWPQAYRIVQNEGTALITQGTAEWADYEVAAEVTVPLAEEAGLAVRVGGQRRWYGLLLGRDGVARLVKACDGRSVLAEAPCKLEFDRPYALSLRAVGDRLTGTVDGVVRLDATDAALPGGGIGLVVTEGCLMTDAVSVQPT